MRHGKCTFVFVEGKTDRKFAAAEVGLLECLAFAVAAFEHFKVFSSGFVDGCFFAIAFDAGVENVDARVDQIADIT